MQKPTGKFYRKILFKKAKSFNDENFILEHSSDQYELCHDIIDRHFMRINGKKLLLCETAMWYQFVGSSVSEQVYNTYGHDAISAK